MRTHMDQWMLSVVTATGFAATCAGAGINLAPMAKPSTSFVSGHETLDAMNDDFEPGGVNDHSHGCYGNWPQTGTQWVQYEWSEPVSTRKVDVYWWDDARGVRLPKACRLLYWDGKGFVPVKEAAGFGVAGGQYNSTTFTEVTTSKLRLEFDGKERFSTGIIEWRVYDSGKSPKFAPRVEAGVDRVTVLPAKTYLNGEARGVIDSIAWSKETGPGTATFAEADKLETTAQFAEPGDYLLKLTARNGDRSASDTLKVRVERAATARHLQPVPNAGYKVNSPFWGPRLKYQIENWIPHCIAQLSKPGLKEGGFENFIQAANKNAGRPHQPHVGPPWANAYTLNTIESMCLALMVDAQGDADLAKAQAAIRAKLDQWIPVVLAAQEPDGYLQTRFTLGDPNENDRPPPRWSRRGDHEGYVAGYLIDAAMAHYRLTAGRDRCLYDAAKRIADCWDANIGPPPKRSWYDGHQELEQALIRLAWLVNEVEGGGKGDQYLQLSKFLLDCRRDGETYDQSHLPVVHQYEALGHAVRAVYCYAAMTGIAMETGDPEYHSAVRSLHDNILNAKYYVTGGVGSGETSEGFGKNYSLPNNAYCESCANCGQVFFQHNMNLAYREAHHADLIEETLYNAVLGSVDLPGRNFTYTNALDSSEARYLWHGCPCCVGNIPRTLLDLPRWMYVKDAENLYVNLFIGGTVPVGTVAGTDVEIEQRTEYPWKGRVEIVVRPAAARSFTLRVRVPQRNVSALYHATPEAGGLISLAVNNTPITPELKDGYAVITRTWQSGDTVHLELPLPVQWIKADERIIADRGRVALRCGALIYNIESVDQNVDGVLKPDTPLTTEWKPDLLGGVIVIRGQFADGSPLLAIPNYARLNRGGRSIVWIRDQ
ncbi:MAG TPA: glycoside hydrolase family 127 protein [Phycisphaerae bacterium]|nr:glycoside hydrolase family 127 protein [Phycisphaerae bacterium]HRY69139.1 glycoside hydrolase family 127 protein [Phycisphaerae bacterium]HSA26100.1 glycoside hydrolase family 127 protein [Phycisphaerae bacterium]